jgi:hypothetical protein
MKIYAVELYTWDGIQYQKLFSCLDMAKSHARSMNREIGIKGYYKVIEKEFE